MAIDTATRATFVDRHRVDIVAVLPGLIAGILVFAVYVGTHPYPAFGAGLFFLMAEQTITNGGSLPTIIPHYAEQVPFAYPPLQFYVVGLLRELTGVDPILLSRVMPGIVSTAYLIPFYLFVRDLLDSPSAAGIATFLLALSPPTLQWHLSAGGIVRSPAALFLITGLYTGLHLFRTHEPKWLVASLTLFTLTVLSHPLYALFFALTYVWLFLTLDGSVRGLFQGSVVGFGGLAMTAPWWTQVVAAHGIDVFSGAAGTHGGIGKRLFELAVTLLTSIGSLAPSAGFEGIQAAEILGLPPWMMTLLSTGMLVLEGWLVVIIVAAVVLLLVDGWRPSRVTVFLIGWLAASTLVISQPRFSFLVGAIVAGLVVATIVVPAIERGSVPLLNRRPVKVAVLVFLAGGLLTVGTTYAAGTLDSHAGSDSLPAFIDDNDVSAMHWAAANTNPDAEFVVVGDAAEWFPYFAERSIAIGPWGMEWQGREAYSTNLRTFVGLSTCGDAACLTEEIRSVGERPDYVYVPTDRYTVRGMKRSPSSELHRDLRGSNAFTSVYRNQGVAVYRVESLPAPGNATGANRRP